jgi:DNA-binding protein H-NS
MTKVNTMQSFEKLLGICTGYGGKYNPGRQNLRIESMSNQLEEVRQALEQVKAVRTAYDNQVNRRKQKFDQLPRLVSSVMRTLEASGASPEKLDDARQFVRMISGRASANRPPVPSEQALEVKVRRSTFQLAYVNKADSFSRLVQAVSTEPLYQPLEPELSPDGLLAMWQELTQLNSQVVQARNEWQKSCIARNFVMYKKPMSMTKTGNAVKKYVRAIYGLDSEQYEQVKSLKFVKLNK